MDVTKSRGKVDRRGSLRGIDCRGKGITSEHFTRAFKLFENGSESIYTPPPPSERKIHGSRNAEADKVKSKKE